jgi:hypothetical protein
LLLNPPAAPAQVAGLLRALQADVDAMLYLLGELPDLPSNWASNAKLEDSASESLIMAVDDLAQLGQDGGVQPIKDWEGLYPYAADADPRLTSWRLKISGRWVPRPVRSPSLGPIRP